MHIEKEAFKVLLNALFDTIKDLLRPHSSLEDIANDFSPQIDAIIKQCQEQGLKYVAGKFKIRYVDEKTFVIFCQLYFQNAENKWQKTESLSPAMDMSYLSSEAFAYLKAHKEKNFDVASPDTENMSEF